MFKLCIASGIAYGQKAAQSCAVSGQSERGYSLVELIAALALIGILVATAIPYLKPVERPLTTSSYEVTGFLRLARARAVATTSAYTVQADSSQLLRVYSAFNCEETTTTLVEGLFYEFPTEVDIADTSWTVCFNGKGNADEYTTFTLTDNEGGSEIIEIYVGGASRIQP